MLEMANTTMPAPTPRCTHSGPRLALPRIEGPNYSAQPKVFVCPKCYLDFVGELKGQGPTIKFYMGTVAPTPVLASNIPGQQPWENHL